MPKVHISEDNEQQTSEFTTRTLDEMEAEMDDIIPTAKMIEYNSDSCIQPQTTRIFASVYEENTRQENSGILENRIANIIEELNENDHFQNNRKNTCIIVLFCMSVIGLFIFGFYKIL